MISIDYTPFPVPQTKTHPVIVKIDDKIHLAKTPKIYDRRGIYTYPLLKYFTTPENLIEIVEQLRCDDMSCNATCEYVREFYAKKNIPYIGICGAQHVLKHTGESSYTYIKLIDYFQESCRIKCRRRNRAQTGEEIFAQNRNKIYRYCVRNNTLNFEGIYQAALKFGFYACSEFNPLYMISAVRYFREYLGLEVKNILDMSAGRGSRMLAAILLNCDYTGIDPSNCTHENYETMRRFYGQFGHSQTRFYKCGFEDISHEILQKHGPYDLMFSSPPYFDLEIYENASAQSINKYTQLQNWLNKFLYVCMHKIITHLRHGGIMAINIDNPLTQDLDVVTPMLKFVDPKCEYIGCLPMLSPKQNMIMSVWCWRKI
jgi:hypothetical protein